MLWPQPKIKMFFELPTQSAHERYEEDVLRMSTLRDRTVTDSMAATRLLLTMESTTEDSPTPFPTHPRDPLIIKMELPPPTQERPPPRTTVLTCSTHPKARDAPKSSM